MTTYADLSATRGSAVAVCRVADLHPERGAAALVDGRQVALFRLAGTDEVLAVSHRDPFTGANVIARGLVGSRGDVVTVASPLLKQVFDLRTGHCLDEPGVALATYPVTVVDGVVHVRVDQTG